MSAGLREQAGFFVKTPKKSNTRITIFANIGPHRLKLSLNLFIPTKIVNFADIRR